MSASIHVRLGRARTERAAAHAARHGLGLPDLIRVAVDHYLDHHAHRPAIGDTRTPTVTTKPYAPEAAR